MHNYGNRRRGQQPGVDATGCVRRNARQFSTGKGNNFWFNPSAFSLPAAGTFTSQHNRNLIYGPGSANYNASLQKKFPTVEGQALSFRFDAFNFPNHPNFATPDTTYVVAAFGKVTSKTGQRSMQASLRYSF